MKRRSLWVRGGTAPLTAATRRGSGSTSPGWGTPDSRVLTSGSWWRSGRRVPCRESCGGSFRISCFAPLGTGRTSVSPSSAPPSPQHSGWPNALDEARARLKRRRGAVVLWIQSHLRTVPSWASCRAGIAQAKVPHSVLLPSRGLGLGMGSDLREASLRLPQGL